MKRGGRGRDSILSPLPRGPVSELSAGALGGPFLQIKTLPFSSRGSELQMGAGSAEVTAPESPASSRAPENPPKRRKEAGALMRRLIKGRRQTLCQMIAARSVCGAGITE